MSNTPLETIAWLTGLYRIATSRILNEDLTTVRTAYETMANGLHRAIMGIAAGNDPDVEVDYLRDSWMRQTKFADGLAPVLFESWAGALKLGVLV